MLYNFLNKDLDLAYSDHISAFKTKFFALNKQIINKKILLCSSDLCTFASSHGLFKYLCRIEDIEDVFIILDPETQTITLAYNTEAVQHKTNIAFHGNQYTILKQESKFYDAVIEDFSWHKIDENYIIVQKLAIDHSNFEFSNDVLDIIKCLRKYKSEYEIICIMKATQIAIRGHRSIAQSYFTSMSQKQQVNEMDLYHTFLSGARITGNRLSYDPIIALNRAGSILHYKQLTDFDQPGHSLLVDCGVSYLGYASDITKTYSTTPDWQNLIDQMALMQKIIIDSIQLGHSFYDIHLYSRRLLSEFLIKNNFVINIDDQVDFDKFVFDKEIDRIFYPHGLGHLLGIDVHDVGSDMEIKNGIIVSGQQSQYIRSNFRVENNIVFTIEPGFYLILELMESADYEIQKYLNMNKIKEYLKFGGIRIETNILIYNNQVYDITKLLENKQ